MTKTELVREIAKANKITTSILAREKRWTFRLTSCAISLAARISRSV